ncbi:MAG: rRNA maturation RNase YbeY [Candidatus Dojkabacteria bacterium]|nr:MAG: rRNA maturation RNase YbeY [Candidatus Dojkabacteria bacterium]
MFEISGKDILSTEFSSVIDFIAESKLIDLLLPHIPQSLQKFTDVHFSFVTPSESQTFNNLYRQIDKPTDVLSFEIQEETLLGELYISEDEIRANASYFNNNPEKECIMIIVHGMLHLLGYDHSDTMFAIQDKITAQLWNDYQTNYRAGQSR